MTGPRFFQRCRRILDSQGDRMSPPGSPTPLYEVCYRSPAEPPAAAPVLSRAVEINRFESRIAPARLAEGLAGSSTCSLCFLKSGTETENSFGAYQQRSVVCWLPNREVDCLPGYILTKMPSRSPNSLPVTSRPCSSMTLFATESLH